MKNTVPDTNNSICAFLLDRRQSVSLIALLIALLPVFDPYVFANFGTFSLSVPMVALVVCFIVALTIKKRTFIETGAQNVLFAWAFISLLACITVNPSSMVWNSLRILFQFAIYTYMFSLSVGVQGVADRFLQFSEIIACLATLFSVVQFIVTGLFHIEIWDGILPLQINATDGFSEMTESGAGFYRVRAFFQEPSYLAIYIVPVLVKCCLKLEYKKAIWLSIGLIVSGSFIGSLGLILCIGILLVSYAKASELRKRKIDAGRFALAVCLTILLLIAIFTLYASALIPLLNSALDNVFDKISSIFDLRTQYLWGRSSAQVRLLGNLDLFAQYPPLMKLLGTGWGLYQEIYSRYIDTGYSSTVVLSLLNCGLLGMLALISWFSFIVMRTKGGGRIVSLFLIACCCADNLVFNGYFFYLIAHAFLQSIITDDEDEHAIP